MSALPIILNAYIWINQQAVEEHIFRQNIALMKEKEKTDTMIEMEM